MKPINNFIPINSNFVKYNNYSVTVINIPIGGSNVELVGLLELSSVGLLELSSVGPIGLVLTTLLFRSVVVSEFITTLYK